MACGCLAFLFRRKGAQKLATSMEDWTPDLDAVDEMDEGFEARRLGTPGRLGLELGLGLGLVWTR